LIGEPLRNLEEKTFLLLTFIVTLAFAWVLWPFYGAILWGAVVAILFAPVNRRLLVAMPHKPNSAALATIAIILLIVILPLVIVAIALIQEAAALFAQIQSGEINFTVYFQQVSDALPVWAKNFLVRSGLPNFGAVQDRLGVALTEGSQYLATEIVRVGQSTFEFFVSLAVMVYLAFFLIRDGDMLLMRIKKVIPLQQPHKRALFTKFTTVVRATVKGDLVVAILQGIVRWLRSF
jgi:predicted PurR-regulated permease PerM